MTIFRSVNIPGIFGIFIVTFKDILILFSVIVNEKMGIQGMENWLTKGKNEPESLTLCSQNPYFQKMKWRS